ncbi:ribbon-helix-helix protein, CopG family [Vagococcus sp. BWB3-3]|uniref:Ribbon-helix-helix protein, CopG family n=1 Tax=Vagococcus allomyrinae TaxID=2794353 RepID=A0A940PG69_9ENTE|nr:DUF6290 family protein [Vagococcus allomyrinae]MBP1044274.1 ribbon-helix-helix protein, CopG family [Vagococcus allomyrinae]
MATITVRVSDEEKAIIQKYAEFSKVNISDIARESILEKIDEVMDLESIREYEKNNKLEQTYSFDEVVKELGYDKELL